MGTNNAASQRRAQRRYFAERETVKVLLNVRNAVSTGGYLSDALGSPQPGTRIPEDFAQYKNHLPAAVQKVVEHVDRLASEVWLVPYDETLPRAGTPFPPEHRIMWWTSAPNRFRKHRTTGRGKGRSRNEDTGLANAVHAVRAKRGVTLDEAKREIAGWLVQTATVQAGSINFSSAMDRVRKALSEAG